MHSAPVSIVSVVTFLHCVDIVSTIKHYEMHYRTITHISYDISPLSAPLMSYLIRKLVR